MIYEINKVHNQQQYAELKLTFLLTLSILLSTSMISLIFSLNLSNVLVIFMWIWFSIGLLSIIIIIYTIIPVLSKKSKSKYFIHYKEMKTHEIINCNITNKDFADQLIINSKILNQKYNAILIVIILLFFPLSLFLYISKKINFRNKNE